MVARYWAVSLGGGVRQTLQVVNRHFKLRTCTDHVLNSRSRPCLQYQIKRCDAPCVFRCRLRSMANRCAMSTCFSTEKSRAARPAAGPHAGLGRDAL